MDETVVLPCICKPLLEQKGRRAHQSGGSKGGNQGLALDYCAENSRQDISARRWLKMGRTQEREIYARLDTASPSCDCEVHFKLTRLIAVSLTCVVLEGD
jgi:hypothetical protein